MSIPVLNNVRRAAKSIFRLQKETRFSVVLIYIVLLFFVAAAVWASQFSLDEVVRGEGRIIPSSEVKSVQHFEGGMVEKIYVKHGDVVTSGQALVLLDSTQLKVSLAEVQSELLQIDAAIARYESLVLEKELSIPHGMINANELDAHKSAYRAERNRYNAELASNEAEILQLQSEASGVKKALLSLSAERRLTLELLEETKKLVQQGAVSQFELKQEEREQLRIEKEIESNLTRGQELVHQISRGRSNRSLIKDTFHSEHWATLSELYAKKDFLNAQLEASADGVERTVVKAPVAGLVKEVYVNAVGGVVQPGSPLLEIVPLEDDLLVEANILPRDIGFVTEGQKAVIKVTAYDFAIYGGLEAVVEHISPDSIIQEDKSFYRIKLRITNGYINNKGVVLKPGMTVGVDILSGSKTVLQYLFKPILRGIKQSLNER